MTKDGVSFRHRFLLRGEDLLAADPREAQQAQQAFLVVARAFGRIGCERVFAAQEDAVRK